MTPRHRATYRALLIGCLGAAAACFVVCWAELVVATIQIAICQFAPAAIGLLLIVVGVNLALRRFLKRLALRPHEVVIIYVMILVAALTTSRGLMERWFATMVAVNYYATPANHWDTTYFPHIPQWAVPFDVRGGERDKLVVDFYEGLKPGQPIPWMAWLKPSAAWLVVILALFGAYACLAAILRKQWVDNEKLSFPLVNLPIELARGESDGRSFFANPYVWIGFALPTVVFTLNGIHGLIPSVPQIPVQYSVSSWLATMGRPWADLGYTVAYCSMAAVGFSYFLPAETLFSLWVCFVLLRIQNIVFSSFGASPQEMPLYPTTIWNGYQVMGAYLVLVAYMVRAARPHLKEVWREATTGATAADASPPAPLLSGEGRTAEGRTAEAGTRSAAAFSPSPAGRGGQGGEAPAPAREFIPYRYALLGLAVSTVVAIVWFNKLGMSLWMAILELVMLLFVVVVVMARSVNEAGMLMTETSFRPVDFVRLFTRLNALGANNLTALSLADASFTRDLRGNLLSSFLDGLKMSDLVKLDRRHLLVAIAVALLVTFAVGGALHIIIPYQRGAITLYGYSYQWNAFAAFEYFQQFLDTQGQYDFKLPIYFGSGLAGAIALGVMRMRYAWWPVAPLGLALSGSWSMIVFWFPIFVAWMVKSLILRYGGMKTYMKLKPLFLGLILGEFSQAVIWATIASVWRTPAPFFPWP